LAEEEQEPTIPHTPEQKEWIAEHKATPPPAQDTSRKAPRDPLGYIEVQKAAALKAGGLVIDSAANMPEPYIPPRDHRCQCAGCDFRVRLHETRLSQHHYGTAFGDQVITVVKMVDGQPSEALPDVVEVNVDDDYAIRVSVPPHFCQNCWKGFCMYRDNGEFGVRLEVNAHNS